MITFISEQLNLGVTAEILSGDNIGSYQNKNEFDSVETVQDALIEYTSSHDTNLFCSSSQSDDSLRDLVMQLSQMRTMKINGIKSPHKAIYIMALMKGIKDGRINHNKIYLDDYLICTFEDLWKEYVPANTPYMMEIGNPFMHLSAEPFYFLHLTAEVHNFNRGWTTGAINRVCDYAYVRDDFKQIVISDENSRIIIEHLIKLFELKDPNLNK